MRPVLLLLLQWGSVSCRKVKGNWQPHKKHSVWVTQIFASPFVMIFPAWKPPLTPAAYCPAIPPESLVLVIVCLSSARWCAVCIFNRNSNPLTFLQSNFQAPKPTLTLKHTRTQTGLSINLPRSWTPPALKSSGLLEQVSPSSVLLFSHSVLSYITLTAKYLHLE